MKIVVAAGNNLSTPEVALIKKYKNCKKPLFLCSPYIFWKIFELEHEKRKRSDVNIYIITFRFSSENNEDYIEIIQQIFADNLRRSDILTWYGFNEALLLLAGINDEEINRIIVRLILKYYNVFKHNLKIEIEVSKNNKNHNRKI